MRALFFFLLGLGAGLPAAEIQRPLILAEGPRPYRHLILDQAVKPGADLLSFSIRAWQDGSAALNADYLDAQSALLRQDKDLLKAAPFSTDRQAQALWLEPPSGTARVRLWLEGAGPAMGSWKADLGSPRSFAAGPEGHYQAGPLQLRRLSDSSAWELQGPEGKLATLQLGEGWSLQPLVQLRQVNGGQEFYLRGPGGQTGTLLFLDTEPLDVEQRLAGGLAVLLQLQGARPRDFTLSLRPEPGDWLLPFNQGLRVPVEELPALAPGYELPLRAGHFVSMPALGWTDGSQSLLLWDPTPSDTSLRFQARDRSLALVWRPVHGAWQGTLGLRLAYGSKGGAKGWAKTLRSFQELTWRRDLSSHAELKLSERLNGPQARGLAGAVNIHYWKRASAWSAEPDPRDLAKEMRATGLDRVLWSQALTPAARAELRGWGWLTGSYENFQDVYPSSTPLAWVDKEGWPEDAVLEADGRWRKGWPLKVQGRTFHSGVRSPWSGEAYVRRVLDERRARGQDAVFLDTTTASGPVEDWDPSHPSTRQEDLRLKMEQLRYASGSGLVTGSESGHDGALPYAHYFEGMQSPWPGRFDDSGYDLASVRPPTDGMRRWSLDPRQRVPLFELAWHDCYVGYEYWGDAANRLPEHWRRRDLFSVLHAQPQLWVLDAERWKEQKDQALKSYRTWSPVVRHLFGQRMTDWRWVDSVGDVQETSWEDGSVIRVDFAKDRYSLKGPVAQAAKVQP